MIAQSHVPAEYLCPITTELMTDPVILADGRSYEREAIAKWLETSSRSPMTGAALEHSHILPNINLKALIEDWRDSQTVAAAVQEEETALQELSRGESDSLRAELQEAFRQEEGLTLVVERIQQVYNPELQGTFNRKVSELTQLRGHCHVVKRFHGTTHKAAAAIAREGFRLPTCDDDGDFVGTGLRVYYTDAQREAGAEHSGDLLMFGQAVYVSTDLEKATRFAQGAVVLCRCAMGKQLDKESAQHDLTWSKLQHLGFDSVRALPACQDSGGCRFEEQAIYCSAQVLPTHIVHFRLVKAGSGNLVAQPLETANRAQAQEHTVAEVLAALSGSLSSNVVELEARRIRICKTLGELARDDQQKSIKKFLSNRKVVAMLTQCAKSSNEALQFEALRVWWNFSFNAADGQNLAMESLGANYLASLLASSNESLRLRAVGLIWNVTQHDSNSRIVLAEAGVTGFLGNMLHTTVHEVTSSMSPPWGVVQLVSGAFANLAVTCSSLVKMETKTVQAAELLVGMNLVCPEVVQQQALRLICNLISDGEEDPEWRRCGFSRRCSAPREGTRVETVA